jgi:dihydrofolate reductase
MKILIVAAMTPEWVIGSKAGLPWEIPQEYQHYLKLVKGHPVIMGRRSFEIFGADLNDSAVIVVSRQLKSKFPFQASGLQEAIEIARTYNTDIFIAGGATIYREAICNADQMHLSEIKGNYRGDVFFPEFAQSDWKVIYSREYDEFIYRIYERNE